MTPIERYIVRCAGVEEMYDDLDDAKSVAERYSGKTGQIAEVVEVNEAGREGAAEEFDPTDGWGKAIDFSDPTPA